MSEMVATDKMAKEIAKANGITKTRAEVLLNLAAAELGITAPYGFHTAAELERIVAGKLKANPTTDRRIKGHR